MTANTDFQRVAYDMRIAAGNFAAMATSATVFGTSLGAFRDFEKQMVLTNAIAGGTVKQFEAMSAAARKFSLATTTSAVDSGAALQQLAQAGFTAAQSLAAMSGVLLLAQATLSDVRQTSDVVASNIRAFGLAASDTVKVANLFTAAITGSLATMDKLAFSLRQVAPVAKIANLSIQETTALLGQLFNVGLRGEQAGTALRNVIVRLIRPLGAAGTLLEKAGIATRKTNGDMRDLASIMRDIGKSSLTTSNLARIFETEALAGALAIIKSVTVKTKEGKTAYDLFLASISGTNRAIDIATQNLDTLDGSLTLLKNSTQDVLITLGEKFAPIVRRFAERLIGLADYFRGLTDEQRNAIVATVQYTGYSIAAVASLSTLGFVLKGLGRAFTQLGKVLGVVTLVFGANEKTAVLYAAALARLSRLLPFLDAALLSTVGAMEALGASALVLGPAGPIVLGLGFIAGAVALGVVAWNKYGEAARNAEQAAVSAATFKHSRDATKALVDGIVGKGTEAELAHRTENIRQQIEKAKLLFAPLDQVAFAQQAASTTGTSVNKYSALLASIKKQEGSAHLAIAEFKTLSDLNVQLNKSSDNFITKFLARRYLGNSKKALEGALGPTLAGKASELSAQEVAISADAAKAKANQDALTKMRSDAIASYMTDLATNKTKLDGQYAVAASLIAVDLGQNGLQTRVVAALAKQPKVSPRDILAEILRQGGSPLKDIVTLLGTKRRQGILALNAAINKNVHASDAEYNKVAEKLLQSEILTAKTVTEAATKARELGLFKLKEGLTKLANKSRKNYDATLVKFGLGSRQGMSDALATAAATLGSVGIQSSADLPAFTELVTGQALVKAIRSQITASTTDKELQAILTAQNTKFRAILVAEVRAMADAGIITSSEADVIRKSWGASTRAILAATLAGVGSVTDSINKAEKQTKARLKSAGNAIKSAENAAHKRLRDARAITDAFRLATREAEKTQKALLDASQGTSITQRQDLTIKFNVTDISNKFDDQIRRLKRKLEDISIGFKGTPKQLEDLKVKYNGVIDQINKAKAAEIASAKSFTSQMAARSKSFDLFKRDLTNFAAVSKKTFDKIAAGVGIAFANYNQQLVTITQISTDAITGMLDTITTGISGFIFDNKNAWESFKASMLNISRQIFEGFTKSLLQQSISSLTGGPGSIFGNALQPSKQGSTGIPSVGTGGALGSTFGKLFGVTSSNSGQAAGIPAPKQLVAPLQSALSGSGQEVQKVFSTFATSITQTLNSFGTKFATALSNALRSVSSGGGKLGGLGGLTGGVSYTPITASVSGGNNIVRSLLGFLGFAGGGHVTGTGSSTSDSILAYLSNGEFVVKADMVRKFRPLLESINSGSLISDMQRVRNAANVNNAPKFATGGLVNSNVVSFTPKVIPVQAAPSTSTTVTNHGAAVTVNVTYNIQGGAATDSFNRSADQHAKQIAAAIQDAQRNT